MAAILPQGRTQFFDNNGNPLALGTVLFYQRNTTTLKNTYTNISLSTANPNPVALDAAGTAVIWGSGDYTMVVSDSNGNQLYSLDTQAPISTSADIVAALGYTPAAQSSVAAAQIYEVPQVTAGTSTAYTSTPSTALAGYFNGLIYVLDPHVTCGASPTLAVSGLAAVPIKKQAGGALTNVAAGDIVADTMTKLVYSAGNWIMLENVGVDGGMPAGMVAPFANSTAPNGWLECTGTAVSRTTYLNLFAAIGTTYGAGDGSTTFNLPDLRGVFIRGWDHGRGVDSGRAFGSTQADALGSHTHTITDPGHAHTFGPSYIQTQAVVTGTPGVYVPGTGTLSNSGNTGTATTGITINATGASETRPVNAALMYCIKF